MLIVHYKNWTIFLNTHSPWHSNEGFYRHFTGKYFYLNKQKTIDKLITHITEDNVYLFITLVQYII